MTTKPNWIVYILECKDKTLYTGITTDLDRRVVEHNHGEKGAKYTKQRRPVRLMYQELAASRSEAATREAALKSLSRSEKITFIKENS